MDETEKTLQMDSSSDADFAYIDIFGILLKIKHVDCVSQGMNRDQATEFRMEVLFDPLRYQ